MITETERRAWHAAYALTTETTVRRWKDSGTYPSEPWVMDYAAEKACLCVVNLRRIAIGAKPTGDGRDRYYERERLGAPETTYEDKCARWESEWRRMAADVLSPEVTK